MSKKQSSIEWLFVELWNTPKDKFEFAKLIEQAKAMHKEEIKEAWYESILLSNYIYSNQYYNNETFGGNNEQQ